jgi:tRNA-specific 2-thiouridylase
MQQQKIGVALSGGVDSSVTASLLKRKGFAVDGFFMLLPLPGMEEHVRRVRSIADHLDIQLHCVDMQELFSRTVIDYFITSYRKGLTPNPCVICNRQIKFGKLLDIMRNMGMEKIATGHYARLAKNENKKYYPAAG